MKVDELVKTCDCNNLLLIVDNKQVVLVNYHEYSDKEIYQWTGEEDCPYFIVHITTVEAKQEAYWND